jgi:hypothetical protein
MSNTTSTEERDEAADRAIECRENGENPDDNSDPIARAAAWADESWRFWRDEAREEQREDAEAAAEAAEAAAEAIAGGDEASELCARAAHLTVLGVDAWIAWEEIGNGC